MAMFSNTSITGIIANRGGWGCNRILDMLDYNIIAANPKPIMGYSDLTGLLNAIHTKTGMITFHGPMGLDTWDSYSTNYVQSIVELGRAVVLMNSPAFSDWRTIRGGKAKGKLIGGNASVFAAMVGSQYLPPADQFNNYILFLEGVCVCDSSCLCVWMSHILREFLVRFPG